MGSNEGIISVRKLAALDIVFHGSTRILIEFFVGLGLTGVLGLWFLYRGLAPGPYQSLGILVLGFVLLGIGLNYLPLLVYALLISRRRSAQSEVAAELAHPEKYNRLYVTQSVIFILVPFALLILALSQRVKRT